jgi:cell division protein FtsW (lipid II flippase)
VFMLLATACVILVMMEASIVTRAGMDDVKESRALLKEVLMLIISLTAGFFMGRGRQRK